jgi:hypothetical protein
MHIVAIVDTIVDQQQDSNNRNCSISLTAGVEHYCAHASNDSTRPLLASTQHTQISEHLKHSAPSSTGSSSGIGSSIESPYNHWKYLTPIPIATSNETKSVSSTAMIEPIGLSIT